EIGQGLGRTPLEKPSGESNCRSVDGRGGPTAAGREARSEVGAHAAGDAAVPEDLELVAEEDRRVAGAVAQPEHLGELAHRSRHRADPREGAEIGGAVPRDPGHRQQARRRLVRDLDERVDPAALVLHVEARPRLLDQAHLSDERGELVRDVLPVDGRALADQIPRLLAAGCAEVGQEPRAHPDRLADVEEASLGVRHAVHAGSILGAGAHVLAEGGVGGHEKGMWIWAGGWRFRRFFGKIGSRPRRRQGPVTEARSSMDTAPPGKIIRDPLWNTIRLDATALRIVDTAEFQRLRYIRQLGWTHLVYPGATHTRFDHALGVHHLTVEALRHLRERGGVPPEVWEGEELVPYAALLHDIGHYAFSHALEELEADRMPGDHE